MAWYLVKHRNNFLQYVFMVICLNHGYVFIVWYFVKHKDNLTFTSLIPV